MKSTPPASPSSSNTRSIDSSSNRGPASAGGASAGASRAGSPTISASFPASSPGGSTKWAAPVSMAACGIRAWSPLPGSCTNTSPPAASIARTPSDPSSAEPLSTTPTARSPRASASDRKNTSTVVSGASCDGRGRVRSTSPSTVTKLPGGFV